MQTRRLRTRSWSRRRALAALVCAAAAALPAAAPVSLGPCFFAAMKRALSPRAPEGAPESLLPTATPADLAAKVGTGVPVVVDVTAKWCGPCKVMEQIMLGLSEKYSGRVSVLKIDLDSNVEFAKKMNVRVLPTVMLFKGSSTEPVHTFKGVVQADVLGEAIEERLLAAQPS